MDQSEYVKHLYTWLSIREENDYPFPKDLAQLRADADHSSLLARLLLGKEPLPIPPPRSFSYPWYELIENGYGHPHEVWEHNTDGLDPIFELPYPTLIIDQSTQWKILEKVSETEWIATYHYGKRPPYQWALGRWRVFQIGTRNPPRPDWGSANHFWKMEKLED